MLRESGVSPVPRQPRRLSCCRRLVGRWVCFAGKMPAARPGSTCLLLARKPRGQHPRTMKAKDKFDFDVAVIGGGSAGYAAARTAAGAGLRTVVIEGGEEVGGLCILRGCMPSK